MPLPLNQYIPNIFLKHTCLCLLLYLCTSSLIAQSDLAATCQTQTLFQQLKNLSTSNLLFGHQNSTFEGIGWEDLDGFDDRSDCEIAVGDYPAVYGFDFVRGFPFKQHTIRAHERGAIITFSDHMDNFSTRGDSWDAQDNSVASVLEEGTTAHSRLIQHLNQVANFFNSLKDKNGDLIPVIYRPYHENTGDWFWWGNPYCTPEEYVNLWRFTVDYLRDIHNIHHVLYAYSPSDPAFRGGYGNRYPGDDYVDIIGFDSYAVVAYEMFLIPSAQLVVEFANERGKIAALTEFGVNGGIQFAEETDWFTNSFLAPLKADPIARELAYALTWRNDRENHHWIPLPESPNHIDFLNFYDDEFTFFESNLPDLYDCDNLIISATTTPTNVSPKMGSLTLGPNPATTFLNIGADHEVPSKRFSLTVFDNTGRLVLENRFYTINNQINIGELPKGIYHLRLTNSKMAMPFVSSFVKI